MAAKVVRQIDLMRALDVLNKRGIVPTTFDLLPGGAVRIHSTSPDPTINNSLMADKEAAAWDEALK